jgi:hypothetical protein
MEAVDFWKDVLGGFKTVTTSQFAEHVTRFFS